MHASGDTCQIEFSFHENSTTRIGIEPTTSAVTGRRSNHLSHRAKLPCANHILQYNGILRNCQHLVQQISIPNFTKPYWISPRPISNHHLNASQHLQPGPINLVLFKGSYSYDGISHLEGGFTLRCLQRLSSPDIPTLLWV